MKGGSRNQVLPGSVMCFQLHSLRVCNSNSIMCFLISDTSALTCSGAAGYCWVCDIGAVWLVAAQVFVAAAAPNAFQC